MMGQWPLLDKQLHEIQCKLHELFWWLKQKCASFPDPGYMVLSYEKHSLQLSKCIQLLITILKSKTDWKTQCTFITHYMEKPDQHEAIHITSYAICWIPCFTEEISLCYITVSFLKLLQGHYMIQVYHDLPKI